MEEGCFWGICAKKKKPLHSHPNKKSHGV
jgi:hypothetical protein